MIITLYISLRYIQCLGISLLATFFFILLIDGSDQLNFFSSNNLNFIDAFTNILLRIPMLTMEALALVVMLGAILTFLLISNSNELAILKASGKSAFRILVPPLIITLFLGLAGTFIGSPVVSVSMRTSDSLLESFNLASKNSLSVSDNDIWLRDRGNNSDMVIKSAQMNSTATIFYDLIIFEFQGEEKLNRKIKASKAILKNGFWELENVTILKSKSGENKPLSTLKIDRLDIETSLTKDQIIDSFADPRVISIYSLNNFINRLETSGYSAIRHKLFFLTELARPFFFIAMLLIAAVFLLKTESNLNKSVRVFLSVFIGFLLFSLQKISESFALTEQVSLHLVAFGPSIASIFLLSGILLHIEDG